MAKAGRVLCIFTPFVLTLAALATLAVIWLAGTKENNTTLGDLYFIKLNMSDAHISGVLAQVTGRNASDFNGALEAAKDKLYLKEYYTVYLRNYCAWDGDSAYSYCSPPQYPFSFDPLEAWGFNKVAKEANVTAATVLPDGLQKGLDIYKKLSFALFYLYAIGTAGIVLTLLVGITAIFSRWGSFVTTFFASLSALVITLASILATAMFPTLRGAIAGALDNDYGSETVLGRKIYTVTWAAAAFSVASFFFWTISICCCSGRSPYNPGSKDARRTRAEKTPYTYERVGSPFMPGAQGQNVPMNPITRFSMPGHGNQPSHVGGGNRATAYEPFRAQV